MYFVLKGSYRFRIFRGKSCINILFLQKWLLNRSDGSLRIPNLLNKGEGK